MGLIGISGKARSGKDVFGEFLASELSRQEGKGYILMSYAHELKNMVQKEFDLSYDQLWGEDKEKEDRRYLTNRKALLTNDPVYWTGREIMQEFGGFYRSIDPDFWSKKLFSIMAEKEYENVIITDVRYPNEVDPILERKGVHIRVSREDKTQIHGTKHSSETSLDDGYKVDFDINNNRTLEDLRNTAKDIAGVLTKLNKED